MDFKEFQEYSFCGMSLESTFKELHSFLHIVLSLHCKCLPTIINFYTFPLILKPCIPQLLQNHCSPRKIFCLAPRILWQPAKSSQTAQIRSVKYFFTATLTPVYHRVFREVLFAANSHFFVIFLSCNDRAMASCWMTQRGLTASGS